MMSELFIPNNEYFFLTHCARVYIEPPTYSAFFTAYDGDPDYPIGLGDMWDGAYCVYILFNNGVCAPLVVGESKNAIQSAFDEIEQMGELFDICLKNDWLICIALWDKYTGVERIQSALRPDLRNKVEA